MATEYKNMNAGNATQKKAHVQLDTEEQELAEKCPLNKICKCCTCRCCGKWMLFYWGWWSLSMAISFVYVRHSMVDYTVCPSNTAENAIGECCQFGMYWITMKEGEYYMNGSCNDLSAAAIIFMVNGISYAVHHR